MKTSFEFTNKQIAMIEEIRKFFGKKTVVTRGELVQFMNEKREKKYAPGFIVKSPLFKVTTKEGETSHGLYRIFSVSKDALRKRMKAAKGAQTATA